MHSHFEMDNIELHPAAARARENTMPTVRGKIGVTGFVLAMSLCIQGVDQKACAADKEIFDDEELAVWGREAPSGVTEPAVPTYYNGQLQGSFKVLEAYDKVPGVASWPLTMADLVANTHVRTTYEISDGNTGSLGTSVVGGVSYRTETDFNYVPTVSQAETFTGGTDRLRTVVSGQFATDAAVSSTRTFPDPQIGSTVVSLTTRFEAQQQITLDSALLGNDAFRLIGMSSMFADPFQYDADAIRWEDPSGVEHLVLLSGATPRDSHLFALPMVVGIGGYFQLVKGTGSSWNPTSPSICVDLVSLTGVTGRVGIQGWLAATTDPNGDSLSLWLEWIDAPATILSGAAYEGNFTVTATPPELVPVGGDVNGDGNVDNLDITPFVAALTNGQGDFGVLHPDGMYWAADVNGDGNVDNLDITPFVDVVVAGQAIPEPATLCVLAASVPVLLKRERKSRQFGLTAGVGRDGGGPTQAPLTARASRKDRPAVRPDDPTSHAE